MIRVVALFAYCLFVSSSTFAGKPDDAAEADLKAMVGKWKVEKAELGGKDATAVVKDVKLELAEGGKYKLDLLGQKDEGTFSVDPSKKPAEMDIKGMEGPNKGKTIKTIYKLEGDTLTVCYELGGGTTRPTKFETKPDTKLFLATYKREKK
jgi:uncharacterized protein (TIGR03067 family)